MSSCRTQPNGYLTVTDGDTTDSSDDLANPSTTDNRIPVTVIAGETDSGNDFLEELPATIGNLVWNDANNSGLRDLGEGPLSGVLVELLTGTGTLITSDTTDVDGLYSFTDLAPGSYQIRIPTVPVGFVISSSNTDFSDATNRTTMTMASTSPSPASPPVLSLPSLLVRQITRWTSASSLPPPLPAPLWSIPLATISQIHRLTISITYALCDALGDPVDDPNTPGVQEYIITSTDGTYAFTNLLPGSYRVKQTQPPAYLTITDGDSTADAPGSPADHCQCLRF